MLADDLPAAAWSEIRTLSSDSEAYRYQEPDRIASQVRP